MDKATQRVSLRGPHRGVSPRTAMQSRISIVSDCPVINLAAAIERAAGSRPHHKQLERRLIADSVDSNDSSRVGDKSKNPLRA